MSQLTVNPLFKPPPPPGGGGVGGLIYFKLILGGGGLYRDRGLFNLELMMVPVVHKELEYKVDKLKKKKF